MSLQHARKRQLVHTGTHNRKVITKLSWQGKFVANTSRESVWANVFLFLLLCAIVIRVVAPVQVVGLASIFMSLSSGKTS